MAGSGRNLCLAGGLGLNALLVSALETRAGLRERLRAAGGGQRRDGHRRGAGHLARRSIGRSARRRRCDTLCLGPAFTAAETKQVLENCKLRFRYLLTTDEIVAHRGRAVERQPHRGLDARPHGVRRARAGQPQHPGVAARPVFHRESEPVHQAPRAVPQVRRVRAGGAGGANISRSVPTRASYPPWGA